LVVEPQTNITATKTVVQLKTIPPEDHLGHLQQLLESSGVIAHFKDCSLEVLGVLERVEEQLFYLSQETFSEVKEQPFVYPFGMVERLDIVVIQILSGWLVICCHCAPV